MGWAPRRRQRGTGCATTGTGCTTSAGTGLGRRFNALLLGKYTSYLKVPASISDSILDRTFSSFLRLAGVSGKCGVFPAALAVEPEVNEKRISSV
jgi:hypothetical protein